MNNEETAVMSADGAVSVPAEAISASPAEPVSAEQTENASAAEQPENDNDNEKQELLDKIDDLEAELLKEQVKVRLLILGILPEKLEDGAAMAYGLCLAGKDIDTAANEIMEAYPHLKAVRRDLPQFSSESAGSGDGFSAIRKIFSAR